MGSSRMPTWFKAFVAKAILFRAALSIVRAKKFAAFQANIVAYTIGCLSWACGGRIDFDMIWARQAISPELHKLLEGWVGKIDKGLRKTAGNRMVSEWAKKAECRDALQGNVLRLAGTSCRQTPAVKQHLLDGANVPKSETTKLGLKRKTQANRCCKRGCAFF